jgi:hypothetical protein
VVRFALAVIVALLAFSTSGVSALIVPEPCTGFEQSGQEDGACPPTCVRCGCCARAAETVIPQAEDSPEITVAEIQVATFRLASAQPHDILHGPKLRPA